MIMYTKFIFAVLNIQLVVVQAVVTRGMRSLRQAFTYFVSVNILLFLVLCVGTRITAY